MTNLIVVLSVMPGEKERFLSGEKCCLNAFRSALPFQVFFSEITFLFVMVGEREVTNCDN